MTIPRIPSYSMPRVENAGAGRARWQPSARRAALLIHDVQEYFLDFFDPNHPPLTELVTNIRALSATARRLHIPVIYTAQPGIQSDVERGLLNDLWGPGITASPDKAGISRLLGPEASDHIVTKWRYSAFRRTGLLGLLNALGRDQLLVTGVYAHIGCLMTAGDAFMHDIQPFLVADAVADFSEERHRMALEYVAGCCGAVTTALELQAHLGARAHGSYAAVASEVADLLSVEASELTPDAPLLDWGLDSLRIMTLVERWRARGLDVSFVALAERPTLAAFAQFFE